MIDGAWDGTSPLIVAGDGVWMMTVEVSYCGSGCGVGVGMNVLKSLSQGSSSSGGKLGNGTGEFVSNAESFNDSVDGPSHQ